MRVLDKRVKKALKGRPIRGFLFLSFLFGMLLTFGSEGRTETKPSLVILPFLVERVEDPEKGVLCPVCKGIRRSGEIVPGSQNTLTDLLYTKMEANGTFQIIAQKKVEEILLHSPSSIQAGKKLEADFIFIGYVFRFEERIGSPLGVERPASVSFDLHLFRLRDEKMVWLGKFDETQRPLSENLLKMGSFIRRKGSWLTAAELASVGMDEMLGKLPGLKELEQ
ncbi:MAG TPA: hypothetical protein VJ462_03000 [Thermodesulfobacteriota bacterium]|nr:hypothetical protein [Thermodesulfobacteriota bacterium]